MSAMRFEFGGHLELWDRNVERCVQRLLPVFNRMVVFSTTDFSYQEVQIRPEAGKLLLFPPFWTHEHRGAVLEKGVKYIATTWVVFA